MLRGTSVAICAFVKTNLLTIQYSMGAMVLSFESHKSGSESTM